jgi:hypothetical protein
MSLITFGWNHETVITWGLGNGILIGKHVYYPDYHNVQIVEKDNFEIEDESPEVSIKLNTPSLAIKEK